MAYKNDKSSNKLSAIVLAKSKIIADEKFEKIQKIARDVVGKEQNKFFNVVAEVMDKVNPPNPAEYPTFKGVTWANLSSGYAKSKGSVRKWRSADKGSIHLQDFFRQTKHIISYFTQKEDVFTYSPDWRKGGKRKYLYRDFSIQPILMSERLKFGNSVEGDKNNKNQEAKITGVMANGKTNEELRPLIEPMRLYFIKHKIPRAINDKVREKLGYKKDKFASG